MLVHKVAMSVINLLSRIRIVAMTIGSLLFTSILLGQVNNVKVYVFLAEECPISIAMAEPLKSVITQYGARAEFVAVFPNRKSDAISMRAFLGRHQLTDIRPVLDDQQSLARRLSATVTPEVVITIDQEEVVYRGRITDAYTAPGRVRHGKAANDLKAAMSALLTGEYPEKPWPEAVGCFITFFGKSK